MADSDLVRLTEPIFSELRKPNGETIKADLAKSVAMVLKSSKAFVFVEGRYGLA